MIRLKYKLNNGVQPHEAIVGAVPSIDPQTNLFLGKFPDEDWLFGEIDTDLANQGALETALVAWSASFFATDQAAIDYVTVLHPADVVVQPRVTTAEVVIDAGGHVITTVTEEW